MNERGVLRGGVALVEGQRWGVGAYLHYLRRAGCGFRLQVARRGRGTGEARRARGGSGVERS